MLKDDNGGSFRPYNLPIPEAALGAVGTITFSLAAPGPLPWFDPVVFLDNVAFTPLPEAPTSCA